MTAPLPQPPNPSPPRMTAPRTWELPPEPGPEVTAVRDKDGDVWKRQPDGWLFSKSGVPVDWDDLLYDYAPLSEVRT